jgi:hypothetical protein
MGNVSTELTNTLFDFQKRNNWLDGPVATSAKPIDEEYQRRLISI